LVHPRSTAAIIGQLLAPHQARDRNPDLDPNYPVSQ
jgi:hypothetical protein